MFKNRSRILKRCRTFVNEEEEHSLANLKEIKILQKLRKKSRGVASNSNSENSVKQDLGLLDRNFSQQNKKDFPTGGGEFFEIPDFLRVEGEEEEMNLLTNLVETQIPLEIKIKNIQDNEKRKQFELKIGPIEKK